MQRMLCMERDDSQAAEAAPPAPAVPQGQRMERSPSQQMAQAWCGRSPAEQADIEELIAEELQEMYAGNPMPIMGDVSAESQIKLNQGHAYMYAGPPPRSPYYFLIHPFNILIHAAAS